MSNVHWMHKVSSSRNPRCFVIKPSGRKLSQTKLDDAWVCVGVKKLPDFNKEAFQL